MIKNYTTMIIKAFFVHSNFIDGSLFNIVPCSSGQYILSVIIKILHKKNVDNGCLSIS